MEKDKKQVLPEPTWREQLYVYGFDDNDIDSLNAIPLHRYLVKMNEVFHHKMVIDVTEIIKDQWPNALQASMGEYMKDYTKARDRKLLKYVITAGVITIIISVSVGLAIFIWWHNKYYPEVPAPISMILSFLGL